MANIAPPTLSLHNKRHVALLMQLRSDPYMAQPQYPQKNDSIIVNIKGDDAFRKVTFNHGRVQHQFYQKDLKRWLLKKYCL